MNAVEQVAPLVGVLAACAALAVSRATFYRRQMVTCAKARPTPQRALSVEERQRVLDVANSERFVDAAPAEIVSTLLDEDKTYLCSPRTMYRILAGAGEVRERRDQLRHPKYEKPQLLAEAPNRVWTWDITKLLCMEKWRYLYLYVVLDIFSRYVVGWMLAEHENATHAKRLIRETYTKQDIQEGQVVIHSDRGAPMTSKTLAQLMADLVITQSHSRPHVSDDNPFIESHFKTAKYRPDFPGRFMGARDGGEHFRRFFDWYNNEHHHSGIAYLTPADVHYGRAESVIAARQQLLDATFAAHPERFVRRPPRAARLPKAVWINPPNEPTLEVAEPQCPLPLAALRDRPVRARLDAERPALARGPTGGQERAALALGSDHRDQHDLDGPQDNLHLIPQAALQIDPATDRTSGTEEVLQ
jgi:putative transposase